MSSVSISGGTIHVSGPMTIRTAAALKGALLGAVDASGAAVLDLSEADDMDTAGFQLLLMLRDLAASRGLPYGIAAMSDSIRSLSELLMARDVFCPVQDGAGPRRTG